MWSRMISFRFTFSVWMFLFWHDSHIWRSIVMLWWSHQSHSQVTEITPGKPSTWLECVIFAIDLTVTAVSWPPHLYLSWFHFAFLRNYWDLSPPFGHTLRLHNLCLKYHMCGLCLRLHPNSFANGGHARRNSIGSLYKSGLLQGGVQAGTNPWKNSFKDFYKFIIFCVCLHFSFNFTSKLRGNPQKNLRNYFSFLRIL